MRQRIAATETSGPGRRMMTSSTRTLRAAGLSMDAAVTSRRMAARPRTGAPVAVT